MIEGLTGPHAENKTTKKHTKVKLKKTIASGGPFNMRRITTKKEIRSIADNLRMQPEAAVGEAHGSDAVYVVNEQDDARGIVFIDCAEDSTFRAFGRFGKPVGEQRRKIIKEMITATA